MNIFNLKREEVLFELETILFFHKNGYQLLISMNFTILVCLKKCNSIYNKRCNFSSLRCKITSRDVKKLPCYQCYQTFLLLILGTILLPDLYSNEINQNFLKNAILRKNSQIFLGNLYENAIFNPSNSTTAIK